MARSERFELPTDWFEASYSIQLSYERRGRIFAFKAVSFKKKLFKKEIARRD